MTTPNEVAGLIERLSLHHSWRDSHGELNSAPNEAAEMLKRLSPTEATEPLVEQAVVVCPQCEGEGGYPDGTDEAACHTDCTRCGGNGWIVDLAALSSAISNAEPEESGEVVQADRWQSDRERLEAVASSDDMALAVNLRERLVELGHNDIARRQALLLDLVVNVFSRHRLAARQSPDSLVEAIRNPTYEQLAAMSDPWCCTVEEMAESWHAMLDIMLKPPSDGEGA